MVPKLHSRLGRDIWPFLNKCSYWQVDSFLHMGYQNSICINMHVIDAMCWLTAWQPEAGSSSELFSPFVQEHMISPSALLSVSIVFFSFFGGNTRVLLKWENWSYVKVGSQKCLLCMLEPQNENGVLRK